MKRLFLILWCICSVVCFFISCTRKPDKATLTIYCTTDVHGSLFDFDLKQNRPTLYSLAGVAGYLSEDREYILLDGGDILQGQPSNYYFNYIDTLQTNITAQVLNDLGYDAAAVGNHDIEAGHPVYDKVAGEFHFPWLAANAIDTRTGAPYFKPYTVLHRKGLKIAVLGMITPGIPKWLPQHLWDGIEFEDMIGTARKWVPLIQEKEHPDLLIGLFHAGYNYNYAGENKDTPRNENATMLVARQVEGFDIIVSGHDHQEKVEEITNDAGHKVLIVDARSHARALGKITVSLTRHAGHYDKTYTAELIDPAKAPRDTAYLRKFTPALNQVKAYIDTPIGEFTETLSGREGLFGPSAFTDFIHNAQLRETRADVSFSTVLQMDAKIAQGEITIRDMFNLYKYENQLYVMRMTGEEIRKHLEMSYDLWVNTMKSPDDHLLLLDEKTVGDQQRLGFKNLSFNFDSAAGIDYEVDVTKPDGEKVKILRMSNGEPFDEKKWYKVAVNSYRGNGGGELLTKGAGIPKDSLESRIIYRSKRDQRYYLMEEIEKMGTVDAKPNNNWKFVPEAWTKPATQRDFELLFGKKQ